MMLMSVFMLTLTLFSISGCGDGSPKAVISYPEANTDEAKFYVAKCGACHAAPSPDIYRASRWIGIVARMQMHMSNKGMPVLSKPEQQIVIDYLEKHAGNDKN